MSTTQDFLFEIGTEEMPSAPLNNAVPQLEKLITQGLDEAGLAHGEIKIISTPRRLAAYVKDVSVATEEIHEVRRGPAANIAFDADGAPTKAAAGFARKFGVAPEELVRRQDTDGKEYVFAEQHIPSRPAEPLLVDLCQSSISNIQWPNYRSQRWGANHQSFVRPVRWLVALLGTQVLPVTFADCVASNTTQGHRVLAPGAHVISEPAAYEDVLEAAFVLDAPKRAQKIREEIAEVERVRNGAHVDTPKRTFDEVVNLCEWPSVVIGTFDEEFLQVPHEIICESMLTNQRYFPIYDTSGQLTREFVVVSNADPACAATVRDGNERVVRARLDDAKFFYEEDLKVPMDTFVERLGQVAFHKKLGSMRQKVTRMESIVELASAQLELDETTRTQAMRAAHLAKADLVSQAVVEFTSQQGVMGGYYARAAHEADAVATAISEHYRPRFAGDELPSETLGKLVALSDKLDSICGLFAVNEPPTGSSDPFALRRSAIGVIAILRTLSKLQLDALIGRALDALEAQGIAFDRDQTTQSISKFFAGRLTTIAREEHIAPDTIEAINPERVLNPSEFLDRCHTLDAARTNEAETFADLAIAFSRADHLGDKSLGLEVNRDLLGEAELALLTACEEGGENVEKTLASGDFEGALHALAELRRPIDRFFDDVMVMDEDTKIRENRIRLLNLFASVFSDVADFGALSKA